MISSIGVPPARAGSPAIHKGLLLYLRLLLFIVVMGVGYYLSGLRIMVMIMFVWMGMGFVSMRMFMAVDEFLML